VKLATVCWVLHISGHRCANEFGVVLAFDGFGNIPYVPGFDLGRTLPHELGHCLVFYIFGVMKWLCGSDFRQSGGMRFPASLAGALGIKLLVILKPGRRNCRLSYRVADRCLFWCFPRSITRIIWIIQMMPVIQCLL
jgi:hypothetical protein